MSKREDIMQATLKLIIEGGFQSLTMKTILNEAKAGYGTLYNHFQSKDELILALYTDLRKKISRVVLDQFDDKLDVEGRMKLFVSRYLEYCIDNIDEINFIEQFSYFYADVTVIVGLDDDGFYKTLIDLIDEGQKLNIIRKYKKELIIQQLNGSVTSLAKGLRTGKYDLTLQDKKDFLSLYWDSIKV